MRLIDADALKVSFGDRRLNARIPYEEYTARELIDNAPTVPVAKDEKILLAPERRKPKLPKPYRMRVDRTWTYFCGNCGIAVHSERDKYCPNCGQMIDWSLLRRETEFGGMER